ncbi:MAG TPA: Na+/H+ antiporter [Candidatus Limnocylindrales bacterium]|nr:Na+/H+ antiporter [Candidatus Limnocylindrales bacterium]
MESLAVVLGLLLVVTILFEVAGRVGVPYPTLLVLGGLAIAFVPGLPHLKLEPDLVLFVFLPPLLFRAAFETSLRDLRANIGPVSRLAIGLVIFTTVVVAAVAHAVVPTLGWPAAFTLGAIVSPTDALAATTVFRRLHVPGRVVTILEGEGLLNDATALIAYRAAAAAAITGVFDPGGALVGFVIAGVGGIVFGVVVGLIAGVVLQRLDDPPVEVAVTLIVPFVAYLPAEQLGLSAVLAAVAVGLVLGRRSATISSPDSRVLGHDIWLMVAFLLNGFAFLLIGLELPEAVSGLGDASPLELLRVAILVALAVVAARFVWTMVTGRLPGSALATIRRRDGHLAKQLGFLISWSGLRGAVSLAAALALPLDFPGRDLILLLTFTVILATLVGQGLTLPLVARGLDVTGLDSERDEETVARRVANDAGQAEVIRQRPRWPTHQPLLDQIEASLTDRSRHLATEDPEETRERRQERLEHEEIRRAVLAAERSAAIDLRDSGEISDDVLRTIERELDLEELRMEA